MRSSTLLPVSCQRAVAVATVTLSLLLANAPGARANSILNGGFETGHFDDWTAVPAPEDSMFFVNGSNSHSGRYAAWFGAVAPVDETITQTIDTVAGDIYAIDFWVAHGATDWSNDFNVYWDGTPILTIVNANSFGYTEYSFLETAVGPISTLQFGARDILSFYYLDDVSVTLSPTSPSLLDETPQSPATIPEPLSLTILGSGLGLLARRRRTQAQG